jgi:hypothetical protein
VKTNITLTAEVSLISIETYDKIALTKCLILYIIDALTILSIRRDLTLLFVDYLPSESNPPTCKYIHGSFRL